jgi:hypothetical protein
MRMRKIETQNKKSIIGSENDNQSGQVYRSLKRSILWDRDETVVRNPDIILKNSDLFCPDVVIEPDRDCTCGTVVSLSTLYLERVRR